MTPVILLKELEKFIKENTKNIMLNVRPAKSGSISEKRTAEVHRMRLPDKKSETQRIPYILLQFLTGKDEQKPSEYPDSECRIRIVAVTYSEDGGEGAKDVLNILTRIRIALLKEVVIGGQFALRKPLEYVVYPDDTSPYYMGEMLTVWEMPVIEREENTHYAD